MIGKKNWLFSNNKNGSDASALLYGIIETAKANAWIIYDYMIPFLHTLTSFLEFFSLKHPVGLWGTYDSSRKKAFSLFLRFKLKCCAFERYLHLSNISFDAVYLALTSNF